MFPLLIKLSDVFNFGLWKQNNFLNPGNQHFGADTFKIKFKAYKYLGAYPKYFYTLSF